MAGVTVNGEVSKTRCAAGVGYTFRMTRVTDLKGQEARTHFFQSQWGGTCSGCLGPLPGLFPEPAHTWPTFLSTNPVAWSTPCTPSLQTSDRCMLHTLSSALHLLSSLGTFLPSTPSSSGPRDAVENKNSKTHYICYPHIHILTHSILFPEHSRVFFLNNPLSAVIPKYILKFLTYFLTSDNVSTTFWRVTRRCPFCRQTCSVGAPSWIQGCLL